MRGDVGNAPLCKHGIFRRKWAGELIFPPDPNYPGQQSWLDCPHAV